MIGFKNFLTELASVPGISDFRAALLAFRQSVGEDAFETIFAKNGWRSPELTVHRARMRGIFARYQWERVGEGAAGIVFINARHPYAVKVYAYDSGYHQYVNWCVDHAKNKYVPKFRSRPVRVLDNIFAVRCEKLISAQGSNESYKLADQVYRCVRAINKSSPLDEYDPDMIELCKFLAKFEHYLDLHDANVMFRTNGSLVVTDPLYL